MAPLATFEIQGSFKITGRGLVIYGDIRNGAIRNGNFFTFDYKHQPIKLQIKSVDFLDNIREKITKIGLTFFYENDKQKKELQSLKATKQTAKITEQ